MIFTSDDFICVVGNPNVIPLVESMLIVCINSPWLDDVPGLESPTTSSPWSSVTLSKGADRRVSRWHHFSGAFLWFQLRRLNFWFFFLNTSVHLAPWPIFCWKRGRFLHCVSMIRWIESQKNPHSDIEEWELCVCLQCSFCLLYSSGVRCVNMKMFRWWVSQLRDQIHCDLSTRSQLLDPNQRSKRFGWCSFIGLWLMYLRCLWKWIHVLFCSHCLGSMGLFTDTKKCDYSGSRIGIWHKTWYNLDTQLFE